MDPIDASSVAALHQAFIAARVEFEAAVRGAGGRWEEPFLDPEDGDDDPWPPHMAAGHALIGERWRFRYIAELLSQPPDAEPLSQKAFAATLAGQEKLAERSVRYDALTGATETIEAAASEWPLIDALYDRLEDDQLGRPAGLSKGQLGYLESLGQTPSNDLRGCLRLAVGHLTDHARQLRTAIEG